MSLRRGCYKHGSSSVSFNILIQGLGEGRVSSFSGVCVPQRREAQWVSEDQWTLAGQSHGPDGTAWEKSIMYDYVNCGSGLQNHRQGGARCKSILKLSLRSSVTRAREQGSSGALVTFNFSRIPPPEDLRGWGDKGRLDSLEFSWKVSKSFYKVEPRSIRRTFLNVKVLALPSHNFSSQGLTSFHDWSWAHEFDLLRGLGIFFHWCGHWRPQILSYYLEVRSYTTQRCCNYVMELNLLEFPKLIEVLIAFLRYVLWICLTG